MSTSIALREIFTAGRPLIEQWLDVAEQIAALRDVATEKGLDWSQLKALMKAQIQDERDDACDGKRVKRIVEKAEFASAYADMLGLANMNENNFSAARSYAEEKGMGSGLGNSEGQVGQSEITQELPETATQSGAINEDGSGLRLSPDAGVEDRLVSAPAESASDEISAPHFHSPALAPHAPQAKTDEAVKSSAASSVNISDEDVPAFLKIERKPLRPNCLHRDLCRSGTPDHCHHCKKAMAESEVA